MPAMRELDWESWLRLALTPGVSLAAQRRLLSDAGSAEAALRLPGGRIASLVGTHAASALAAGPDRRVLSRCFDWLSGAGRWLLTLADPDYPRPLLEIADPPSVLFGFGRRELLSRRCVAVVGSRNASRQGEEDALCFSTHLSQAGLCVVSGLALGIDGAAHRGGLTGVGGTIAVLGNGLDRTYPAAHASLADHLSQSGLMLSEHAPGEPPRAHHFPRRNRLISGLCEGVLVVEAAERSGSLVTARLALEQGRDVFAVPGSIHSPVSRGCHRLIKDGAALVENPGDVLAALGFVAQRAAVQPASTLDDDEILTCLGTSPAGVDLIIERTGRAPQAVLARLADLEIGGRIERLAGGLYRRLHRSKAARGIE